MELKWVDGYQITFRVDNETGVISANREGLLSLASHLQALAEEPSKAHVHLDEWNSLEEGSAELIIEKVE